MVEARFLHSGGSVCIAEALRVRGFPPSCRKAGRQDLFHDVIIQLIISSLKIATVHSFKPAHYLNKQILLLGFYSSKGGFYRSNFRSC